MKYKRKYFCQDDASDSLEVGPLGRDCSTREGDMLRLVCNSIDSVSSVHLNVVQVSDLVKLLNEWLESASPPTDTLWENG